MKEPPVLIEGVRLRLRRSTPDDAPQSFRAAAQPEVMRYLEWPAPRSVDDTRAFLQGCQARWEAGTEYHWAVIDKRSSEVIGSVSCRVQGHAADFSGLLAQEAWGHGYGTEAGALLVGWLRRQPEILRIWATADNENARARRVLGKLGLEPEGVLRMATWRPQLGGPPRDTAVFASVREAGRGAGSAAGGGGGGAGEAGGGMVGERAGGAAGAASA